MFVACPLLLEETGRVLAHKYERPMRLVRGFVQGLDRVAEQWPDPRPPILGLTRDPRDDYIAALGMSTGLDLVVARDKDLLHYTPLRAVTPEYALAVLRNS